MAKRKKKRINSGIKSIFDTGLFILLVLVITYILSKYVVERMVIQNHSMEPTIESGDSILIDKFSYRVGKPKRFDVIVFKNSKTGEKLIKRIIGLPGETIQINEGSFLINGEVIKDASGLEEPSYAGVAIDPVILLEDEYFVVGDNRAESIDSRYEEVGLVASSRIIGKMFVRILPIKRFKIFING